MNPSRVWTRYNLTVGYFATAVIVVAFIWFFADLLLRTAEFYPGYDPRNFYDLARTAQSKVQSLLAGEPNSLSLAGWGFAHQYNALFAVPLAPVLMVFGESYYTYGMAVALIYGTAATLAVGGIAVVLLAGYRPSIVLLTFAATAFVAVTRSAGWYSTIFYYPDIGNAKGAGNMTLPSRRLRGLGLVAALVLGGCGGPTIIPAESWTLPAKEGPDTAMFVGRIGRYGNDKQLILNYVAFQQWGKVYFQSGTLPKGEKNFVMDNNYFVVPNVKPGKYWFAGFHAAGDFNRLPADKKDFIDVKPGQVKFVGSFDYVDGSSNTLRTIVGMPGTFSLKPAATPSEIEMLRWLLRVGNGSGWEPAVKQRMRELGGKP